MTDPTPTFGPGDDKRPIVQHHHEGYLPAILEQFGKYVDIHGRDMDAPDYIERCKADQAAADAKMQKEAADMQAAAERQMEIYKAQGDTNWSGSQGSFGPG